MKKALTLLLLLFAVSNIFSQENSIPDSFLQEIESEIGIWIGDNSKYKSDQEPFEAYAIEWSWGINKKSLVGKLYGIQDGVNSNPFWEFRKYWDAEKKAPIVMQFGADGTVGIGASTKINENESELLQIFTSPNGSQNKIGHKTKIIDSLSHTGSSYLVNEQGEWTENRSYLWVKEDETEKDANK